MVEEHLRRYVVTQTCRRLHQPVFRATVVRAYGTRCAVCSLACAGLLDAAHIVADADPLGIASVRNGLALGSTARQAERAASVGVPAASLALAP